MANLKNRKFKYYHHLETINLYGVSSNGVLDAVAREEGYIKSAGIKHILKSKTNAILKNYLREHNLPVSGNKSTLIERIANNITEEEVKKIKSKQDYYELTDKGFAYLEENKYLNLWEDFPSTHVGNKINSWESLIEYCKKSIQECIELKNWESYDYNVNMIRGSYDKINNTDGVLYYKLQSYLINLNIPYAKKTIESYNQKYDESYGDVEDIPKSSYIQDNSEQGIKFFVLHKQYSKEEFMKIFEKVYHDLPFKNMISKEETLKILNIDFNREKPEKTSNNNFNSEKPEKTSNNNFNSGKPKKNRRNTLKIKRFFDGNTYYTFLKSINESKNTVYEKDLPEEFKIEALKNEHIREGSIRENLNLGTVKEMKKFLKINKLKISGKKLELIKRIYENISEEKIKEYFPKKACIITEHGKEYLNLRKYVEYNDVRYLEKQKHDYAYYLRTHIHFNYSNKHPKKLETNHYIFYLRKHALNHYLIKLGKRFHNYDYDPYVFNYNYAFIPKEEVDNIFLNNENYLKSDYNFNIILKIFLDYLRKREKEICLLEEVNDPNIDLKYYCKPLIRDPKIYKEQCYILYKQEINDSQLYQELCSELDKPEIYDYSTYLEYRSNLHKQKIIYEYMNNKKELLKIKIKISTCELLLPTSFILLELIQNNDTVDYNYYDIDYILECMSELKYSFNKKDEVYQKFFNRLDKGEEEFSEIEITKVLKQLNYTNYEIKNILDTLKPDDVNLEGPINNYIKNIISNLPKINYYDNKINEELLKELDKEFINKKFLSFILLQHHLLENLESNMKSINSEIKYLKNKDMNSPNILRKEDNLKQLETIRNDLIKDNTKNNYYQETFIKYIELIRASSNKKELEDKIKNFIRIKKVTIEL